MVQLIYLVMVRGVCYWKGSASDESLNEKWGQGVGNLLKHDYSK